MATCPFAAALPHSRTPISVTSPNGTIIHVRRRCPAWIRFLRFTAKYIAKAVLTRTAKSVIISTYKSVKNCRRGKNCRHLRRLHSKQTCLSTDSQSSSLSDSDSDSEFDSDSES